MNELQCPWCDKIFNFHDFHFCFINEKAENVKSESDSDQQELEEIPVEERQSRISEEILDLNSHIQGQDFQLSTVEKVLTRTVCEEDGIISSHATPFVPCRGNSLDSIPSNSLVDQQQNHLLLSAKHSESDDCAVDEIGSNKECLATPSDPDATSVVEPSGISNRVLRNNQKKLLFCDVCERSFMNEDDLQQHYKTHTGEKAFECVKCGKGFSLKSNLKVHLRIHTGEKPYKCRTCNKRFAQQSNLQYHIGTHMSKNPNQCIKCKKVFRKQSRFLNHLCTNVGDKPYSCEPSGQTSRRELLSENNRYKRKQGEGGLSPSTNKPKKW